MASDADYGELRNTVRGVHTLRLPAHKSDWTRTCLAGRKKDCAFSRTVREAQDVRFYYAKFVFELTFYFVAECAIACGKRYVHYHNCAANHVTTINS